MSVYSTSARFALVETVFGTEVAGGATSRLAIGEGVFAVGVALAIARIRAIDAAAEEDLCGGCRTKRLAHLNRRRMAAGQRKILAVAAAHAKRRPGARCHGSRRRRGLLVEAERIGKEVRLPRALALLFLKAAEEEIENSFGGRHARCKGNGANERDGSKHHAAPPALTRQLCTQRLLHPTQQTHRGDERPDPDSP